LNILHQVEHGEGSGSAQAKGFDLLR